MQKFRNPVLVCALQADKSLPRELAQCVEFEARLLLDLYATNVMRGSDALSRFLQAINEFCDRETLARIDAKAQAHATVACDDWQRGLRSPLGACTNCGAKH